MTEQTICVVEIRYSSWIPGWWTFLFAAEDEATAIAELNRIMKTNLHWFENRFGIKQARHRIESDEYESFRLSGTRLITSARGV